MTIQTIDELLDFVDENFEKISNKGYVDLCRSTMQLYEFEKPSTKKATLERIERLYNFTLQYPDTVEMPLFIID